MFTSSGGGASKDEAGKVAIPLEQTPTSSLCLSEDMSMSYIQRQSEHWNILENLAHHPTRILLLLSPLLHFLMQRPTISSDAVNVILNPPVKRRAVLRSRPYRL